MTPAGQSGRYVPGGATAEIDAADPAAAVGAQSTGEREQIGSAHVFLHVGTMKSGTSYLQSILRRNRRALATAGMLAPTRYLVPAVADILQRAGKTLRIDSEGEWARLVAEIDGWAGRSVVVSQEFLCAVTEAEAQRIVDTLPGHKFTVVITARDLARVIPSHWQTTIKGNKVWSFADYVPILFDDGSTSQTEQRAAVGFWRHHDIPRAVDTWASVVGIDNVVLVTVPPSGAPSDLLWRRFAEVIGVEPEAYDHTPDAKSNVSLDYAETEMLRAVNAAVRGRLSAFEYRDLVNHYIANRLLRTAPSVDRNADRPRLGPRNHALVAARAEAMVESLRMSGVRVVGDLDELLVPPFTGDAGLGDDIGPQQPIPASVPYVISKLVLRIARLERELAGVKQRGASSRTSSAGGVVPAASAGNKRAGKRGGRRRVSPAVARRLAARNGNDDARATPNSSKPSVDEAR